MNRSPLLWIFLLPFFGIALECSADCPIPGASTPAACTDTTDFSSSRPCTAALTAGTQGLGISLGYRLNPYLGLRLRGATIGYDSSEYWGSARTRIQLNGDNAGLLLDIHPFGGNFYITAGLTLCESNMRYRARFHRKPGGDCPIHLGGMDFQLNDDQHGTLAGRCQWDKLQPYIGIGYTGSINAPYPLYYALDLGLNYMGSGHLSTTSQGNFQYKDKRTNTWKTLTSAQLETALRHEGHDFFRLADHLHLYPVLQLSIGLQF